VNRNTIKRIILETSRFVSRFGLHVLPVHYYSPVPSIPELERTRNTWRGKSDLVGIDANVESQLDRLRTMCLPHRHEYATNENFLDATENRFGPGYGFVEAMALHGVIRSLKPRRIIEVGAGVSTFCMLKAAKLNEVDTGTRASMTSIEPFPSSALKQLEGVEVIQKPVQEIAFDQFQTLEAGDFLFIDSSHTVKPGGDVNYLILEVLPRLRPGVLVHFHDIYLPYDYQRDVLQTFMHWSETSLLHAYLLFNDRARIVFCLSHLHYDRTESLKEIFPGYDPQLDDHGLQSDRYKSFERIPEHFPSSIYIEIL
jgi:predicted O-methyltransferase YrrM